MGTTAGTDARRGQFQKTRSSLLHASETGAASCTIASLNQVQVGRTIARSLVSCIAFWRRAVASMIHLLPLLRPTLAYLPGHMLPPILQTLLHNEPYGLGTVHCWCCWPGLPMVDRPGRPAGHATCLIQQEMIISTIKLTASNKNPSICCLLLTSKPLPKQNLSPCQEKLGTAHRHSSK
jgi:hypothetical protein